MGEEGAPDTELASYEDLIQRVLAKEYAIEHIKEPKGDSTEGD